MFVALDLPIYGFLLSPGQHFPSPSLLPKTGSPHQPSPRHSQAARSWPPDAHGASTLLLPLPQISQTNCVSYQIVR